MMDYETIVLVVWTSLGILCPFLFGWYGDKLRAGRLGWTEQQIRIIKEDDRGWWGVHVCLGGLFGPIWLWASIADTLNEIRLYREYQIRAALRSANKANEEAFGPSY